MYFILFRKDIVYDQKIYFILFRKDIVCVSDQILNSDS